MTDTANIAAADARELLSQITDMTGPQLVSTYNTFAHVLGIKEVSRFSNKSTAIRRVGEVVQTVITELENKEQAQPATPEQVETRTKRAAGQRKAWNDAATRAARSARWGMHVTGHGIDMKFRSCRKAFAALQLNDSRHQYVRKLAIQNGSQPYAGYMFTRCPLEEVGE